MYNHGQNILVQTLKIPPPPFDNAVIVFWIQHGAYEGELHTPALSMGGGGKFGTFLGVF